MHRSWSRDGGGPPESTAGRRGHALPDRQRSGGVTASDGGAVAVEPDVRPPSRDRSGSGDRTGLRVRHGVKALVASADRVLLVKERHADRTPYWTLPGGGVHDGESPPAALRRELGEELGCRAVVAESLTTFRYLHTSIERTVSVYDVRACSLLSRPAPVAAEGVHDVQWADPADPPARTLPHVERVLDRLGR